MPEESSEVVVAVGTMSAYGTFVPESVGLWRVLPGEAGTLLTVTTLARGIGPEYDGHCVHELAPDMALDAVRAELARSPSLVLRRLFGPGGTSLPEPALVTAGRGGEVPADDD